MTYDVILPKETSSTVYLDVPKFSVDRCDFFYVSPHDFLVSFAAMLLTIRGAPALHQWRDGATDIFQRATAASWLGNQRNGGLIFW